MRVLGIRSTHTNLESHTAKLDGCVRNETVDASRIRPVDGEALW